jgi:hypothetical protein
MPRRMVRRTLGGTGFRTLLVPIRHEEILMSPVLSALDAEWTRIASTPAARRAVAAWGATQPALRGLVDLDDVLERRRDRRHERAVLAALAALAASDPLAARTLLQALLPGIVRLAITAGYDDRDASAEMVALAWERIRTYPSARAGSVAGNVLLDVKKWYRRHRSIDAPRSTAQQPPRVLPPADAGRARSAEDEAMDRVAFADLVAAQKQAVGSRNLRVVVRAHVEGVPLAELAAEEDLTVRALTMRRWRTEQKLARQSLARLDECGEHRVGAAHPLQRVG